MSSVKPVLVNRSLNAIRSDAKHPLDEVRGAYDFDSRLYDPGVDCLHFVDDDGEVIDTPSLTRQADKDDCDINVMMARYQSTGVEPRVNPRAAQWGDFADVPTYQEALNVVRQADEDFALLPAEVRERFGNDPSGMLRFLSDEENRAEAIKLGLVNPPAAEPPPQRVEIVTPAGQDDRTERPPVTVTAKPAKPA